MSSARPVAGEGLLHPGALVAIVVLAVNDHWAKAHLGGAVTGKLSDLAGLVFFPLLLQALWELGLVVRGRPWLPSSRVLRCAALATALVFASVKVWPPASEAYRVAFGVARWPLDAVQASLSGRSLPPLARVSLTPDRTDLLALPAVLVALAIGRSRASPDRPGSTVPARPL